MIPYPHHATAAQIMAVSLGDAFWVACAIVLGFILMEILTSGPDDPDGFA